MSSELMSRPSTSKMHARIGGRTVRVDMITSYNINEGSTLSRLNFAPGCTEVGMTQTRQEFCPRVARGAWYNCIRKVSKLI